MFGRIGNGGFCLRKVELFKKLCIKYAQEIQLYNSFEDPLHNEDIFWALVPTELKLPTIEQAADFAFDRKLELCYKINNNKLRSFHLSYLTSDKLIDVKAALQFRGMSVSACIWTWMHMCVQVRVCVFT